MDRNEVLVALSRAEVDYVEVQSETKTVWEFQEAEWKAKALRAAAEIIRESGWRPIAEFTDENEYLTGGRWDQGKWYEYSGKLYWLLAHRCTHARVSPEPPAREVTDEQGRTSIGIADALTENKGDDREKT